MTPIDKIVHYIYFLLFGPVSKFIYSSSKDEIKVTLFFIISILVLLTHIVSVYLDMVSLFVVFLDS